MIKKEQSAFYENFALENIIWKMNGLKDGQRYSVFISLEIMFQLI